VRESQVDRGLCTVSLHHTGASLVFREDADPSIRGDLERFFAWMVPDGDPDFRHTTAGPDDMPTHFRMILTRHALAIPVAGSRCDLGSWRGLLVWQHRAASHRGRITASVVG